MYGSLLALLVGTSLLLYLLAKPIVDYFRDPKGLRKYPTLNPLCGFTNVGFMYEAHMPFRSKKLQRLHKEFPVIRIGPNMLSYGDIRAIKDIYGHGTPCNKDSWYEKLSGTHRHLADVADRAEHARKRKVLSSAYALKNLENWEHKVVDKTARLIRALDARCTGPMDVGQERSDPSHLTVNYRQWANFFTIDAIADIGLSERLGLLDRGDDTVIAERMDGTKYTAHYRECLHNTARAQCGLVWSYGWFEYLIQLSKLFSPRYRKMWKLADDWSNIVWHLATKRYERYQKGELLDDFFQVLMEDKKGRPNNLPWGEVFAEVSIMLNAGSDTTAIAMNNALYLLLKNPRCLQKLREEIDAVASPDDVVIPYDKVRHLMYLRACLDEAMRVFPPTTFGLPRRTPPEGCMILNEFIPGDTSVSISSYVSHRDETLFPDPETYRPERWLQGDDSKELQLAFSPFSTGARGCIGRNISYLEQTVLLASVVYRYELALPSQNWEQNRWEVFNLMPGDLPVKVWRREIANAANNK